MQNILCQMGELVVFQLSHSAIEGVDCAMDASKGFDA
jgi:hypothetical protein